MNHSGLDTWLNLAALVLIMAICIRGCQAQRTCESMCSPGVMAACDSDAVYRVKRAGCIGTDKAWTVEVP